MAVRERHGSWQADVKLGPTRYRETFKTKPEAEAWELEAKAAHKLGKPVPKPGGGQVKKAKIGTLGELVRHATKLHWASKKSGESLAHNAILFESWAGPNMDVRAALSAEKIHEYIEYRQDEKGNSSATVNRHLSAISVLLTYGVELKLCDPVKLPWQEEGVGRLRYFTEKEEEHLFHTLTLWHLVEYRHLFAFLADTGLRLGEAQKLRWEDIRGRSITVEAANAKNHETRTVTATTRALQALISMRELNGAHLDGPFHWVRRDRLRAVWERLRAHFDWMGDDTVIHTFRHTCASRLVQRGVDLYRVKTWMGHKSLSTTMRYAHLAPKHLEELADVLDRAA